MLRLRRNIHPPRVEMTPLIDVIFLLLTFFIYSLVVTVHMQVLPVTLTPVAGADLQAHREPVTLDAITLARDGRIYFNNTPLAARELPDRLQRYARERDGSRLFVAMETTGDQAIEADRGPLLIWVIEQLRTAGIDDFAIVGQPASRQDASATQPAPSPHAD